MNAQMWTEKYGSRIGKIKFFQAKRQFLLPTTLHHTPLWVVGVGWLAPPPQQHQKTAIGGGLFCQSKTAQQMRVSDICAARYAQIDADYRASPLTSGIALGASYKKGSTR
jgi:hypothetical protein